MPVISALHKFSLLLLLLNAAYASAQYYPAKNDCLNFTSVCFEFPWMKQARSYEILLVNETTGKSAQYYCSANKLIVDGLAFGTSYNWTVSGKDSRNKTISTHQPIHFSIGTHPHLSSRYVRFREVTNNHLKRGSELLIFDYAQLVLNHDLETVWFLPSLPFMNNGSGLRDLKLTADGTFLAIIDSNAYELSRTGKVLWKAPNDGTVSGGTGEDYHHDLQKLASGNYMVLGNEHIQRKLPGMADSVRFQIGTIIEYTPDGTVAWEWHAKDFFTDELLMLRRKADGSYETATHMNAFTVSGSSIYAGFRDASWILKIDKTSKKVTELYGGPDSGLSNHYAKGLFAFQHDVNILRNGAIAVVNNDSIKSPNIFSSLVVFSQGEGTFEKGEERFRFYFNYDSLTTGKSTKLGNMSELRNGNYLVNMGAINRVFEVTPKGELVWDVLIEQSDTLKNAWRAYPQYRVAAATSLYPNEFAVKWEASPEKDGSVRGQLVVFNVGPEPNSYTVFSERKDGLRTIAGTIPLLHTGQSGSTFVDIPDGVLNGETRLLVKANGKSTCETITIRKR